ncbi:DUF2871 domain-containing protein [Corynebacterium felinum]|uniref:DUF2871 domain-containing protein n=1 Tax=Corynebacterium felinum TaxID=131318 RepID=A0ABU2BB73_9CORY|nr:DUF2871 domain-containing protein [Corynebacterium felinum]MDF5820684.1 DUF2871 domain-containing protein [Corynebacterium felinum]MDR7355541.1 hypothetical protein [Corynebacterium felinum]WJY94891.1 hypothetical protein CFELI_06355 [Corynebacterium felinum]
MKKLLNAAAFYTVLGLLAGVFYREFTRAQDFVGQTRLSTVHTHILVLGMIFFLVMLALAATLKIHENKNFTAFFWTYNCGVVWTAAFMTYKGIAQVENQDFVMSPMMAGLSGIGHIILTVGIFLLFKVLYKQVKIHQ